MSSSMPDFFSEDYSEIIPIQDDLSTQVHNIPGEFDSNFNESPIHETSTTGRFTKLKSYLSKSVMDNSIRTFLVVDTALGEYNQSALNSESLREKTALRYTAGMTVVGQAYERLRLPEVLGVAATTRVYREGLENGWNSGIATSVAAITLGSFVYVQQKIIGRNFVNTAKYFPNTYDTVNRQWPKTINAIGDAIPSEKNRISEGYGMFGLGTTPFIASTRAANPEISVEELKHIEKRVTRRGSWFAGAVGATILGVKSLSVHVPSRIGEEAVKRSDQAIDLLSNPYLVAGGFMLWSVAKTTGNQLRKS